MSIKKIILITATLLLAAMTAMAQNNAEELIFSKTGGFMPLVNNTDNLHGTGGTPFGFWIWCAAEAPSGTPPTYQTFNVCQGSMYFYFLGGPEHVASDLSVSETPPNSGLYTITVHAADFTCTLKNLTNVPGPNNSIMVTCTFDSALGGGTGTTTVDGAVVHTTGPS